MIVESLKLYVTVVEQRNFSKAAEILHISQPGVSSQIRNLEKEFNVKLMHRSPKWVKLTEAGELLYVRAKEMLNLYESVKLDIARLQDNVSGSLQIGASFTIGEYVLPRLFSSFAKQYPDVSMEVFIRNSSQVIEAVRRSDIDFGLVEEDIEAPDLKVTTFMRDELIIVAAEGHPLSLSMNIDLEQLQHQIWVLRETGSGTRSVSDRFLAQTGLRISRSYVFNSSQSVKEAVFSGLGIAMLSRWVVKRELSAGVLKEISIPGILMERNFSLVRRKDQIPTRANEVFSEKLLKLDNHFIW
ncbi:LysR family transcriptional regulator [Paenibacillus silvae]|uniref:LysR family transcriptional regulator n=1 Tax=Paenibacillus silvae TaxID=1325358 RepID=UPI00200415A8|nr:LysR family transcriptional regulator [Paenibacillus silvae]MCK6073252.1 LysR family transcriptional regulator [Paenibacillus silvae]MCK6149272.1 LysR family transcriptional regulator [Paenibacillus silvae]MCK6267571.1 LysR family transcriptional regulator [Paenibacillus silvae]